MLPRSSPAPFHSQLGTVIPDDFVQAFAHEHVGRHRLAIDGATTLNVDYIHSYGDRQTGSTDRNLPVSGAISASNPRPEPQFTQVVMLENYTKNWYDALESELRTGLRGGGQLHVLYTLSRTWLDGVDFFITQRGTQRTPQEQGYSPGDQRHNLTAAAIIPLPFEMQFSAILKLDQRIADAGAGRHRSGRRSVGHGRSPDGLPITVGRR